MQSVPTGTAGSTAQARTRCQRPPGAGLHPSSGEDEYEGAIPPRSCRHHVLRDECQRHGKAADESPARPIVPAQEQIHRHRPAMWMKRPIIRAGIAIRSLLWYRPCLDACIIVFVLAAPLRGNSTAFGCGAKPAKQRVDGEGDNADDRDLAECIEAAEIDQNDVHHIGPAGLAPRHFQERSRASLRLRPHHHA